MNWVNVVRITCCGDCSCSLCVFLHFPNRTNNNNPYLICFHLHSPVSIPWYTMFDDGWNSFCMCVCVLVFCPVIMGFVKFIKFYKIKLTNGLRWLNTLLRVILLGAKKCRCFAIHDMAMWGQLGCALNVNSNVVLLFINIFLTLQSIILLSAVHSKKNP